MMIIIYSVYSLKLNLFFNCFNYYNVGGVIIKLFLYYAIIMSLNNKITEVNSQSPQDTALCSIVAATNIRSVKTQWSCTAASATSTAPCTSGAEWYGLICSSNSVISIDISNLALTGIL